MNHAHNQKVDLYWETGANLGELLMKAAPLVDKHEGYSEVHTHMDYESSDYEIMVYLYS